MGIDTRKDQKRRSEEGTWRKNENEEGFVIKAIRNWKMSWWWEGKNVGVNEDWLVKKNGPIKGRFL
jgi:hypothetical protein